MPSRAIAILGSTGSIGTTTLRLVDRFPDRFNVVGLSGGDNVEKLAEQVKRYRPRFVSARTLESVTRVRELSGSPKEVTFLHGTSGAETVASESEADCIISAIVGAAGLCPTLAAIGTGKTVAIANKESLVVAGSLVRRASLQSGAVILPVDSEHSAIFQALGTSKVELVRRLILTASGGPFFLRPEVDLERVSPEEALKHPNWEMGAKVTIDSATMMNKGLELIEAHWLFGVSPEQLDVLIHPQSLVHSMVEFLDGSVIAQLGVPDMQGPISYALAYPDRLENAMDRLNLGKVRELTFFAPDHVRFPALLIAQKALAKGETYPAVLNGANEVSVQAFLKKRIGFLDIPRMNEETLASYPGSPGRDLDDFLQADSFGREKAESLIKERESRH